MVIGPLATPPESKAMPTNSGGTSRESTSAMRYPGIRIHWTGTPVSTRSMASPTLTATPTDRHRFIAPAEMEPLVTSCT